MKTKAERDTFILANFPHMPTKEIARRVHRSVQTVEGIAYAAGLKKTEVQRSLSGMKK